MKINKILDMVIYHATRKEQDKFKELCEKKEGFEIIYGVLTAKPEMKKLLRKIRLRYKIKLSILIAILIITIWSAL